MNQKRISFAEMLGFSADTIDIPPETKAPFAHAMAQAGFAAAGSSTAKGIIAAGMKAHRAQGGGK